MTNAEPLSMPAQPAKRYIYGGVDFAAAVFALGAGYLFTRLVLTAQDVGFGCAVAGLCFAAGQSLYLRKSGRYGAISQTDRALHAVFLLLSVLCFAVPALYGYNETTACSVAAGTAAYGFAAVSGAGARSETAFGALAALDFLRGVIALPFSRLFSLFGALAAKRGGKDSPRYKTALAVAGGLALAILPCAFIAGTLAKGDAAFSSLAGRIMESFNEAFGLRITCAVLALPAAAYGFAAVRASMERSRDREKFVADGSGAAARPNVRVIPAVTAAAALWCVVVVYVLYFVSQLAYFTLAFSYLLPDGFSASEYARSGFFGLCSVACVNGILIGAAAVFARKDCGAASVAARTAAAVLSLETVGLSATAVAKMALYVRSFGLTRLRVLTTLFMVALGLCFLLAAAKALFTRLNIAPATAVIAAVSLLAVTYAPLDAMIVRYNADAYMSGALDSFDFYAASELGDYAAVEAAELLDCGDEAVERSAKEYIETARKRIDADKSPWYAKNAADIYARSALDRILSGT